MFVRHLRSQRFALGDLKRPALALALLAGALTSTLAAPLGAHAAPDYPASCNAFVSKYLESGAQESSSVYFSLVTHMTHIGNSDGPVGFSGGTLQLRTSRIGGRPFLTSLSRDDAQEFFSDRIYFPHPGNLAEAPFNPDATDSVGLSISRYFLGGGFNITLTLKSWGNAQVPITPLNCIGDNLLYGTASDTLVSLVLGELIPPPR